MTTDAGVASETQAEPTAETGTETVEQKTYAQSDVDALVSKALKTREENLKREFEKSKLVEERKYKELFEQAEAEKRTLSDSVAREKFLRESGLNEFAPILAHVPVDDLPTAQSAIQTALKAMVEKTVSERIKTNPPIAGQPVTGPKSIKDMTPEEYAKYRVQHGIQ